MLMTSQSMYIADSMPRVQCKGCGRVDVPLQEGPPADLAVLIEARIELEAAQDEEKRNQKDEKAAIAAVDKFLKQERKEQRAAEKKMKSEAREAAQVARARKRDAAHLAFLEKAGQDLERGEKKAAGARKKRSKVCQYTCDTLTYHPNAIFRSRFLSSANVRYSLHFGTRYVHSTMLQCSFGLKSLPLCRRA